MQKYGDGRRIKVGPFRRWIHNLSTLTKMKFLPIVFILAAVCLAVTVEAQTSKKPAAAATTTKKPATLKTTVKPTTTRTSKTIATTKPANSKTTVKPSNTPRTTAKPTTVKKTAATTPSSKTTTSKKTPIKTTVNPSATKPKPSPVATKPTTTRTGGTASSTPSPVLFDCLVSDPACGNMCGNVTSPTTGLVQSPNYPGDYGNESRSCFVKITAPKGWMIRLKFTTFKVETGVCSVYVADDVTYLLSPTCGDTIPAVVPATVGSMKIGYEFSATNSTKSSTTYSQRWQSTLSVTSQGNSCSVQDPLACGNMCGDGTSNDTAGVVQSVNFPADYGVKDRYCVVTVVVPAGKRIRLEFTKFDLDKYGSIDVADADSYLLSNVTGSTIPPVVDTTTNIAYIFFTTRVDQFSISTSILNWQATYTAVTDDSPVGLSTTTEDQATTTMI